MWADTLLQLERAHLLRLLIWGAASVITGTAVLTWLAWRHDQAPMLRHFALQCAVWGLAVAALAFWGWQTIALRDFSGLQRLLNMLWLTVGLGLGFVGMGGAVSAMGARPVRRPAAIGAGIGIIVQGVAVLLFHLRLIGAIGPMQ